MGARTHCLLCILFGHRWHIVYRDPCSQHPIPIYDHELDAFEVECWRCGRHEWK